MHKITIIDIAKNVFQLHAVSATGAIHDSGDSALIGL